MSKAKKHKTHIKSNNDPVGTNRILYQIMPFTVLAIGILSMIGMLSLPTSTIPANFEPQVIGAPSLAILSEELVDHGDVSVNQFIETEFVIQNVGDEVLHIFGDPIIEVIEGCCPVRTTVENYTLKPGEITTIRTRFTMHPGMDGYHDFRVHVVTNDPAQPEKELTILSNWVS